MTGSLLARLEWQGGAAYAPGPCCPCCEAPQRDGHDPGCELAAALVTGDDRRELELWRQVFGPATLAQLKHLAGSVHCNCNPVCGHEEEYCAEYDRLGR